MLATADVMLVLLSPDGEGNVPCSVRGAPLSAGEGGSFSSSESESESDDSLPELSGESGLSGPSASSPSASSSSGSSASGASASGASASGASVAAGTGVLLATATCRRTCLGTIFTGDGRRSWYRAMSDCVVYQKDNRNRTPTLNTGS